MGFAKSFKSMFLGVLIVSIFTSFAAGEKKATEKVAKGIVSTEGRVTRVYDVREIIVDIPDCKPLFPGWFKSTLSTKTIPGKSESELVAMLIKAIKEINTSQKWDPELRVSFLKGNLVITTKPDVHDQIASYINGIHEMFNPKIDMKGNLLSVDAATDKKLRNKFKAEISKDKTQQYCFAFLTHEQLEEFIRLSKESSKTKLLTLPKTTQHNGQQVCCSTISDRGVELPILKEYGEGKIYTTFEYGVVFAYDATISRDRKYITITFDGCVTDWVDSPKNVVTSTSKIRTTVTIPDNSVIVFRKPVVYKKVRGVAITPDGKLEVKEDKIDTMPEKFLYFILQPKIIEQKLLKETVGEKIKTVKVNKKAG